MLADEEDVYFYITLLNENYEHPGLPEGAEEGILKGMYLFREGSGDGPRVQLLGSGSILREVIAGGELLESDFGVAADVWSATSFTELRREGLEAERWSMLHPAEPRRQSYVEQCLAGRAGPVVASTDYMTLFPDQIRPFVGRTYAVLGTDGFGRSDYRVNLRRHFEVDRHHVVLAALNALARDGVVGPELAQRAISHYDIDPERLAPARA
jgi:pyruvate dehydrogenase E1 component